MTDERKQTTESEASVENVEVADASAYYKLVLSSGTTEDVEKKLRACNLVILPTQHRDTLCYSQESVEFVKHCREANPTISIDLLNDEDVKTLSLNSIDVWMPVVLVAEYALLPIVINLVSSYIYDKFKGHDSKNVNVEVDFLIERDGEKKMLSYKGDVDGLRDGFEKIDISKL